MLTENKCGRLADIKARLGIRVYTAAGPSGPILNTANWQTCVTVADVEWLGREVERLQSEVEKLRGEVAELLAGSDADALIITQAGRDQVRMRAALAKLVSVLVQGAYIVYGGDGYDHCLDCYAREGHSHEADCIYLTVLPDLRYLELEEPRPPGRRDDSER